ncbi:fluoride efflux transporter CrcB [Kistimonas scapharcae]|uniref:Fluoride-specific ion channel FluC n=1 Tax=Kistimonas scapharcae TaxID=1036133 RepID=A0ABP8UYZ1_9GAMM|nr:MAG: hypothetical protein B0D91_02595 [Oceanospirillales bacterium LUC14_002_19_P2]
MFLWFEWIAIALGGALGAVSRALIYLGFAELGQAKLFPVPTLVANIIGSFIIGVTYYALVEQASLPPIWRQFIMVGFLGALTTFSTFSLDAFRLIQDGDPVGAIAYMLTSVAGCLLATWAGYALAGKVFA